MAEATLVHGTARRGAGPTVHSYDSEQLTAGRAVAADQTVASVTRLVGCGRPAADARLVIVDPATGHELPAGQVGEIWVSGANVASQYWRQPELSLATFHLCARRRAMGRCSAHRRLGLSQRRRAVHQRSLEGPDHRQWAELSPAGHRAVDRRLSPGDQGPWRRRVLDRWRGTRAADRGARNRPAEEVRPGRSDASHSPCSGPVHDLALRRFAPLVCAGTIPKTTSGKLQRRQCRELYLRGELESLESWDAATSAARRCGNHVEPRTSSRRSSHRSGPKCWGSHESACLTVFSTSAAAACWPRK